MIEAKKSSRARDNVKRRENSKAHTTNATPKRNAPAKYTGPTSLSKKGHRLIGSSLRHGSTEG